MKKRLVVLALAGLGFTGCELEDTGGTMHKITIKEVDGGGGGDDQNPATGNIKVLINGSASAEAKSGDTVTLKVEKSDSSSVYLSSEPSVTFSKSSFDTSVSAGTYDVTFTMPDEDLKITETADVF